MQMLTFSELVELAAFALRRLGLASSGHHQRELPVCCWLLVLSDHTESTEPSRRSVVYSRWSDSAFYRLMGRRTGVYIGTTSR